MSAQLLAFSPAAVNNNTPIDSATASGMFADFMLMELVLEVARSSKDPQGRLAELFDRINARARRGSIAADKPNLMSQFRKRAESFFVLAGNNV